MVPMALSTTPTFTIMQKTTSSLAKSTGLKRRWGRSISTCGRSVESISPLTQPTRIKCGSSFGIVVIQPRKSWRVFVKMKLFGRRILSTQSTLNASTMLTPTTCSIQKLRWCESDPSGFAGRKQSHGCLETQKSLFSLYMRSLLREWMRKYVFNINLCSHACVYPKRTSCMMYDVWPSYTIHHTRGLLNEFVFGGLKWYSMILPISSYTIHHTRGPSCFGWSTSEVQRARVATEKIKTKFKIFFSNDRPTQAFRW